MNIQAMDSHSLTSPAGDPRSISSEPADPAEASQPPFGLSEPLPTSSDAADSAAAVASASTFNAPPVPQIIRMPTATKRIRPGQTIRIHPAAAAYPVIKANRDLLRDDIREKGILKPIILLDDQIADGVQRWGCAVELGMDCPAIELTTEDLRGINVVDFVKSLNEQTRRLTKGQYAMVAAHSREPYVAAAKARRREAGRSTASRENSREVPEEAGDVRTILGKKFGIGENLIDAAVTVLESGCDKLIEAVEQAKVSAFVAAELAALPENERAIAADLALKGDRKGLNPYLPVKSHSKKTAKASTPDQGEREFPTLGTTESTPAIKHATRRTSLKMHRASLNCLLSVSHPPRSATLRNHSLLTRRWTANIQPRVLRGSA